MTPNTLPFTLISILIHLVDSQVLNQYQKSIGPDGEEIWQSTSPFVPVQSKSFGNITIGNIMTMEFDFIWNGYSNDPYSTGNQYENFFRIGFSSRYGSGCDGHGSRYPLCSASYYATFQMSMICQ